jgi:hypothetical protein
MTTDLKQYLSGNTYPGRGILLGRSADNTAAVIVYFIMGRSENSRNRIFVPEGEGLRTQAFDPSKMKDSSLIIYAPVRVLNGFTVVTNGDQTDTVYKSLSAGGSFEDALRSRTFEPDAPNFTPRISGLVAPDGSYRLSILKSADGDPNSARRFFYEYKQPVAGQGHIIHTYRADGDPLPSFAGEPVTVSLQGSLRDLAELTWNSLDQNNRVSLFARSIRLSDGTFDSVIINRNA